jgi:hypothetical protein
MRKLRKLKSLEGLSNEQVNLLAEWVEAHPYRKAVELVREKFGRYVSKSALHRFRARRVVVEIREETPEALQAAREVNRFAARAEANFSAATVHLLERQAFDLALAGKDEEDLERLKALMWMLQRNRANDIHERRVRVLEARVRKPQNKTEAEREALLVGKAVDKVLNGWERKKGAKGRKSAGNDQCRRPNDQGMTKSPIPRVSGEGQVQEANGGKYE